jgi:hypothetical protein
VRLSVALSVNYASRGLATIASFNLSTKSNRALRSSPASATRSRVHHHRDRTAWALAPATEQCRDAIVPTPAARMPVLSKKQWRSSFDGLFMRFASPTALKIMLIRLSISNLVQRHPLFGQFLFCFFVLCQVHQSHATQDIRRLGELNVVVTDDLYSIAPRVTKIQERTVK